MPLFDLWLVASFFMLAFGSAIAGQPFFANTRDPEVPINRLQVVLGAVMFVVGMISLVGYQSQNLPY